jgi:hypothetical protein
MGYGITQAADDYLQDIEHWPDDQVRMVLDLAITIAKGRGTKQVGVKHIEQALDELTTP